MQAVRKKIDRPSHRVRKREEELGRRSIVVQKEGVTRIVPRLQVKRKEAPRWYPKIKGGRKLSSEGTTSRVSWIEGGGPVGSYSI